MQLPFEGFVVPSLPHIAALFVLTLAVVAVLFELRPRVTGKLTVAFAPWMVTGAGLHVLYQLGQRYDTMVYAEPIEPLFSAPAVYVTTFVLMGIVWTLADIIDGVRVSETAGQDAVARKLGVVGTVAMFVTIGLIVRWGQLLPAGPISPLLPMIGLFVTLGVTAVVYLLLGLWRTYVIAETRYIGELVLFAHVFDGITTAIGVDILGVTERSVLPARIMEFAASLPTAPHIGSAWLFVVVKITVAVAVLVLFADFVREEPTRANILLAVIVAVGLGPGANNFLLFLVGAT